MLSFANVVHLFANKFPSLRAGRFAFPLVLVCSFNDFFFRFFRHVISPGLQLMFSADATGNQCGSCCIGAGKASDLPLGVVGLGRFRARERGDNDKNG